MCCIFTCCGWMIDLIQRAWVFAMSCCISSAVCCVLLTSSMSGVALGYNYSLAEYMDLKETNVSIYLKRGIFDDDVSDDMDWRRSAGHQAVRGFANNEGDLLTHAPDDGENTPLRSGRRLDDSILESNDNNKFEGSLMKLTARPPHPLNTKPPVTSDLKMQEIFSQYPQGSLDQLKGIQNLISMRKAAAARDAAEIGKMSTYAQDERYVPDFPGAPLQARRMMSMNAQEYDPRSGPERGPLSGPFPGQDSRRNYPSDINPARLAVPDSSIGEWRKWMAPKHPQKSMDESFIDTQTYPQPIRYMTGPVRPTRPPELTPTNTEEPTTMRATKAEESNDRGMKDFKEKLILDKYESPRLKSGRQKSQKSDIEYYEDEIKGLPVRKKRNISRVKRKVVSKVLHQKLQPSLRENALDKREEISITNEITNKPSILVSRLLYSNNGPAESLKRKMNAVSDINSTTDGIVKILRSMFS